MSTKKVVFDWNHRSIGRRVFFNRPPPPQWCWGPTDVILEESTIKTEPLDPADIIPEISEPDADSVICSFTDQSNNGYTVLEYHHGDLNQLQTKKYLVNPLYRNCNQNSDKPPTALTASMPKVLDEQKPIKVEQTDLTLPENMTIKTEANVKLEINRNISVNKGKKRRAASCKSSDLDHLIGQKLNKVRMSSRSYAARFTLNDTPAEPENQETFGDVNALKFLKTSPTLIKEESEMDEDILNIEKVLREMEESSDEDQEGKQSQRK